MRLVKLLLKWWVGNGPGSVGSIARTMAKSYLAIKRNYPDISKRELLKRTLSSRVRAYRMLKQPVPGDEFLREWLEYAKGSLTELTWSVILWEHSELYDVDNEAYATAREVVEEEIEKYVPKEVKQRRLSFFERSSLTKNELLK